MTGAGPGQHDAVLWSRVLAQEGVPDPVTGEPFGPTMLTGLAGGIGFMCATFAYAETTTATLVLRAHPEPWTDRLLERTGVNVEVSTTSSPTRAEADLDAVLDSGRVAVIRVVPAALPWGDAENPMDQESVDVLVRGREGDGYLVDTGEAERPLTRVDLAAARAARKSDKHRAVSLAADPGGVTTAGLVDAVRASIEETTGRMLGTLPLTGIPASWLPKFGVAGMRTWARLLRDPKTKKGWPALFADPARLRSGLTMLRSTALDPRWGGPGGLRGTHADFLAEAALLPGLADLGSVVGQYRGLAEDWDAFLGSIDPEAGVDERIALFADMADHLEELADREELAATDLATALPPRDREA